MDKRLRMIDHNGEKEFGIFTVRVQTANKEPHFE